jgi:hypothetical protein
MTMPLKLFLTVLYCAGFSLVHTQARALGMEWNLAITLKAHKKIQLVCVSCREMPANYAAVAMFFAQTHNITDRKIIDQCIFSTTYLYENITDGNSEKCPEGTPPLTALIFMNEKGLPFLHVFPEQYFLIFSTFM